MDLDDEKGNDVLRFGSSVTLYYDASGRKGQDSAAPSGFVWGEGFSDSTVGLVPGQFGESGWEIPSCYAECVFVVLPKLQYSAATSLASYKANRVSADDATADSFLGQGTQAAPSRGRAEGTPAALAPALSTRRVSTPEAIEDTGGDDARTLARLQESAAMEQRANREIVHASFGKEVRYGMTVQLLHQRSRSLVTVKSKEVSASEADSNAMALSAKGTFGAHFTLLPRYKHRQEGDRVHMDDQVVFFNREFRLALHVSSTPLVEARVEFEVNASMNRTPWRIRLYASPETTSSAAIRGGDIVRLFHWEAEGYLMRSGLSAINAAAAALAKQNRTKAADAANTGSEEKMESAASASASPSDAVAGLETATAEPKASLLSLVHRAAGVYQPQLTDKQATHAETFGSNSLWEVELPDPSMGGEVAWGTPVRFRHVGTRRYLSLSGSEALLEKARDVLAHAPRTPDSTESELLTRLSRLPDVELAGLLDVPLKEETDQVLSTRSMLPSSGTRKRGTQAGAGSRRASMVPYYDHQDRPAIVSHFLQADDEEKMESVPTLGQRDEPLLSGVPLPSHDAHGRAKDRSSVVAPIPTMTAVADASSLFIVLPTGNEVQGLVSSKTGVRLQHLLSGTWLHADERVPVAAGALHQLQSGAQRLAHVITATRPDKPDTGAYMSRRRTTVASGGQERRRDLPDLSNTRVDLTELTTRLAASPVPVAASEEGVEECAFELSRAPAGMVTKTMFVLSTIPALEEYAATIDKLADRLQGSSSDSGNVQGEGEAWATAAQHDSASTSSESDRSSQSGMGSDSESSDSDDDVFGGPSSAPARKSEQYLFTAAYRALSELIFFCIESAGDDPLLASGLPVKDHQDLLVEQGVIDLLVRLVRAPFAEWGGPFTHEEVAEAAMDWIKSDEYDSDDGAESDQGQEDAPSEPEDVTGLPGQDLFASHSQRFAPRDSPRTTMLRHVHFITQLAYRLISSIFRGNGTAELHVAKHLDTFTSQLGYGLTAETVMTELVSENRDLLEMIPPGIVLRFLTLIRTKGKQGIFLNFLTALCSCRGRGVPSKQDLVCDFVFGNADGVYENADHDELGATMAKDSEVILPMRPTPESARSQTPEWGAGLEVFIPTEELPRTPTSTAPETEPEGDWIDVIALYRQNHPMAEYLTSTIRLFTEMCVDRNYVCITEIEAMLPLEQLVACISSTLLDDTTRAAFCRLLFTLHLDRGQQERLALPVLTQLWKNLDRGRSIPRPASPMPAEFTVVKRWVVKFLANQGGAMYTSLRSRNELLLSVLELANGMLRFGFFATQEELALLVQPAIRLLDGRTDRISVPPNVLASPEFESATREASGSWHSKFDSTVTRGRDVSGTRLSHRQFSNPKKSGTMRQARSVGIASVQQPNKSSGAQPRPEKMSVLTGSFLAMNPALAGYNPQRSDFADRAVSSTLLPSGHKAMGDSVVLSSKAKLALVQGGEGKEKAREKRESPSPPGGKVVARTDSDAGRYERSADFLLVVRCKLVLCDMVSFVGQIRTSTLLAEALRAFHRHYNATRRSSSLLMNVQRPSRRAGEADHGPQRPDLLSATSVSRAKMIGSRAAQRRRQVASRASVELSAPKVSDVRGPSTPRNDHSSGVLSAIRGVGKLVGVGTDDEEEGSDECLVNEVLDAVASPLLQWSHLARYDIVMVLMDLMSYADTELRASATALLFSHFNQNLHLLSALRNVQLLVSEATVKVYGEAKSLFTMLRKDAEQSEIWLSMSKPDDLVVSRRVHLAIAFLGSLMWTKTPRHGSLTSAPSSLATATGRPDAERQRLLFNMGVHDVVLDLLDAVVHTIASRKTTQRSLPRILSKELNRIIATSIAFLSAFVACGENDVQLAAEAGLTLAALRHRNDEAGYACQLASRFDLSDKRDVGAFIREPATAILAASRSVSPRAKASTSSPSGNERTAPRMPGGAAELRQALQGGPDGSAATSTRQTNQRSVARRLPMLLKLHKLGKNVSSILRDTVRDNYTICNDVPDTVFPELLQTAARVHDPMAMEALAALAWSEDVPVPRNQEVLLRHLVDRSSHVMLPFASGFESSEAATMGVKDPRSQDFVNFVSQPYLSKFSRKADSTGRRKSQKVPPGVRAANGPLARAVGSKSGGIGDVNPDNTYAGKLRAMREPSTAREVARALMHHGVGHFHKIVYDAEAARGVMSDDLRAVVTSEVGKHVHSSRALSNRGTGTAAPAPNADANDARSERDQSDGASVMSGTDLSHTARGSRHSSLAQSSGAFPLLYHIRQLHLLSRLSVGRDRSRESHVQQLAPLSPQLVTLADQHTTLPVRTATADVLLHTWIDAEKPASKLRGNRLVTAWIKREALFLEQWAAAIRNEATRRATKQVSGNAKPGPKMGLAKSKRGDQSDEKREPAARADVHARLAGTAPVVRGPGRRARGLAPLTPHTAVSGARLSSNRRSLTDDGSFADRAAQWLWKWQFEVSHVFGTLLPTLTLYYALFCARGLMSSAEREAATAFACALLRVLDTVPAQGFKSPTAAWMRTLQSHHLYVVAILLDWLSDFVELPPHLRSRLERHLAAFVRTERVRFAAAQVPALAAASNDGGKVADEVFSLRASSLGSASGVFDRLVGEASPSTRAVILRAQELVRARPESRSHAADRLGSSDEIDLLPGVGQDSESCGDGGQDGPSFPCMAHAAASSLPDPMNHIARRWWRATGKTDDEAALEDDFSAVVVSEIDGHSTSVAGQPLAHVVPSGGSIHSEEKSEARAGALPLGPKAQEPDKVLETSSLPDATGSAEEDAEADTEREREQMLQIQALEATRVVDAFHSFLDMLCAHPKMEAARKEDFAGLCRAHLLVDATARQLIDGAFPSTVVPLTFNSCVARLITHLNSLPTTVSVDPSAAAVTAAAGGITKKGSSEDDSSPTAPDQGSATKSNFVLARRAGADRVKVIQDGGGTSSGLRAHTASELLRITTSKETLVTTIKMLRTLTASLPLGRPAAQRKMADIGVAGFFLDKLGEVGADPDCFAELIEGLITLLDGGNEHVQMCVRNHLAGNGYDAFFEQVYDSLEDVMAQVEAEAHGALYQSKRGAMRVFRLLQLLCEGHNLHLQNFLRKQGDSLGSVNLVAQTAKFFHNMHDKIASREAAELAEQVLDTLVEFIQGPCLENQMAVVQNKFVEAAGFIMSVDSWPGVDEDLQMNLHYKTVLALVSLFEGRHDRNVHTRVAGLLPLDVMRHTMVRSYSRFMTYNEGEYTEDAFLQRYLTKRKADFSLARIMGDEKRCAGIDIGFAVYILLRQLVEAHTVPRNAVEPAGGERRGPTRIATGGRGELSLDKFSKLAEGDGPVDVSYAESYAFFASHCGRIEIQRNGELEYFLFPVPPVCAFLTKETMSRTEWELDRESPNTKIGDLFDRMEGFIVEMMHQQWVHAFISSIPVLSAIILSVRLWKRLSWFMALFINFLLLACYETDEFNRVTCSDKFYGYRLGFPVNRVIFICGIVQTATSSLIVVHFLLNHAPLIVKAGRRAALAKLPVDDTESDLAEASGIVGASALIERPDATDVAGSGTDGNVFAVHGGADMTTQSAQSLYSNLEEEMVAMEVEEGEDDDDVAANESVLVLSFEDELSSLVSCCPYGIEGVREPDNAYGRLAARQGYMLLKSALRQPKHSKDPGAASPQDQKAATSSSSPSQWASKRRMDTSEDPELVSLGRKVLTLGTRQAGASALYRGFSAATLAAEAAREEAEAAPTGDSGGPDQQRGQKRSRCSACTQTLSSWWSDASYLWRSGTFLYWISYIVFTLAGNIVHPFAFAYHLTDIVNRYEELRIVLRAVTKPIKQLSLTFLLMIVTEWIFTVVAFYTIRSDFQPFNEGDTQSECNTLLQCFATMFDQGFKNDGGIGGYLVQLSQDSSPLQHYTGRLIFDQLFNILLVTVLLNVTFGIIVDTFGALREQTKNKEEDMATVCFVCSIDRSTFDRHTRQGFEHHVEHDHDKWNYVYAAAHLQFKPRTERTGVEEYLWHAIHKRDASFFPLHRAAVLQDALTPEEEADQLRNKVDALHSEVAQLRKALKTHMGGLKKAITSVSTQHQDLKAPRTLLSTHR